MIADMGTKPLTTKTLKIFMGAIGMRQMEKWYWNYIETKFVYMTISLS
jgi:hypothetical protein